MNRHYTRHHKIFALGLPFVWLLLNLLFFKFHFESPGLILVTALIGVIEIAFLFFPSLYKKFYQAWNWFTRKIGQFNTYLILSLIFYLVFTPIALILRLLGKDLLDQKFDSRASSYWHPRPPGEKKLEDYRKIF